jgi:hypothetical protein
MARIPIAAKAEVSSFKPIIADDLRVIDLVSEEEARLAGHMAVLQKFDFRRLKDLGVLKLGNTASGSAILQRAGMLTPTTAGSPFLPTQFAGLATSFESGVFKKIATPVFESPSVNAPISVMRSNGTSTSTAKVNAADILIDKAYWFGNIISIAPNTTIIIAAEITSLVIICNTLNVGSEVTITWERPSKAAPTVPPKNPAPIDMQRASAGVGANTGAHGYSGANGSKGEDGDPAPEIEFWFLSCSGFPAIDLKGQNGFGGGQGGFGTDGGKGQDGCDSTANSFDCKNGPFSGGSGGKGGQGGIGGLGGNGGLGGAVSIYYDSNVQTGWPSGGPVHNLTGGDAGQGGAGGIGGNGGPGGSKGNASGFCANSWFDWSDRVDGQIGPQGDTGSTGLAGVPGQQQVNPLKLFGNFDAATLSAHMNLPAIVTIKSAVVGTANPAAVFSGDPVMIDGNLFSNGDNVHFEGVDGTISVASTTTFVPSSGSGPNPTLLATVPESTGGHCKVQVVKGTTRSNIASIYIKPKILAILPTSRIRPGEWYFVKGSGFTATGAIRIDNQYVSPFERIDSTTIKFKCVRPTGLAQNAAGESATLVVVNSTGGGIHNPQISAAVPVILDTYRTLVFGDSVMWGGGLLENQKFYSLATNYLVSKLNGIGMYTTVKAHHGAPIGASNTIVKPEIPGEMSTLYPTVTQQVQSMLSIPDANEVDLVFLNGGPNDIPITSAMLETAPADTAARVALLVQEINQYSYIDLKVLLLTVCSSFPNAKIIVPGYFHIFSNQSDLNFLGAVYIAIGDADNLDFSVSGTTNKLVSLCDAWIANVNVKMLNAVNDVNTTIAGDPRVHFVDPQTNPSNAAHAPNSFLWEPDMDITNVGGPTDPMWTISRMSDREVHKTRLESEPAAAGKTRYSITKQNSSYHPNVAGAQNYFNKMIPTLDSFAMPVRIALQSQGKYVSAVGGGGASLKLENQIGPNGWELLLTEDLGNQTLSLKTNSKLYVCAEPGGSVVADRPRRGAWETFTKVATGGTKFKLQTHHGDFLDVSSLGLINATSVGTLFQTI